jgi:hypothetical protein
MNRTTVSHTTQHRAPTFDVRARRKAPTNRAAALTAALFLIMAAVDGAAAEKPRTSTVNYTTAGGVTGQYPQQFLQFAYSTSPALEEEVIGGGIFYARGSENRFEVSASDLAGLPVAVSLYWYDDLKKPNRTTVICGKTDKPLPLVKKGAVHAIVTAGPGCPGTVSAPTRGTLTFTWSTAPTLEGKRRS